MRFEHQRLRRFTDDFLRAAGSGAAEARIVADHLVDANLRGHDSHGVGMLPHYVRNLKAGTLIPNRAPTVVQESGTFAVWDGQNGYGQVIALDAMDWVIATAKRDGVAVHGLRNTHHIGRVGTYGEKVVASGLVAMHFVSANSGVPKVTPFRGREGRLSTNPICIAVPGTGRTPPVVLDMATSRIALGKVRVAHNEGRDVIAGALIGPDGKPTNDPSVIYEKPFGAVLPFGEHKGYGLALIAELLAGAVVGDGTIQSETSRSRGIVNGMLTVAIDPERLSSRAFIEAEVDAIVAYLKATTPADPALPVLVPGEPERIARAQRMRDGIEVDRTTWHEILAAAESIGAQLELP